MNTRSARLAAAALAIIAVTTCSGFAEGLSDEDRAIIEAAEAYQQWPDEKDLPLPPQGWYTLDIDGETLEVFRDDYGIPHVFAPSIETAFAGQGYVITEDRCLQLLSSREAVRGRRAAKEGPGALHHDIDARVRCYPENELQAMLDDLRPDQRTYLDAYLAGVNAYLRRYAPKVPPLSALDLTAGTVYYMRKVGDGGGDEHHIYKLLALVKFLCGREFMWNMVNDCLPLDVPNAPTTDHSCRRLQHAAVPAPAPPLNFDPAEMLVVLDQQQRALDFAEKDGQFTKWGSQVWTVRPERSATGHAMLFASPMMNFVVPARAAQVHLVAPGLDVAGACYIGIPGVVIGYNDRLAWGSTSGLLNQTDMFVERINPDNPEQYWHNGQWKDMQRVDTPIPVRQDDGSYKLNPCGIVRTVHGPVVHRFPYNHRAYVRSTAHARSELASFCAFIDMNLAQNLDDFERAVRQVCTSHNFFAADVDGNIGYWLSGRLPKRHPDQDPRFPTPGTGEYDWQGLTNATDPVHSVNPPEGWFGNFNSKPSVKVPGWWPEEIWGYRITETLERENPIDWDTFVGINKANGEHHWCGPFFKGYLVRILRERVADHPEIEPALRVIEAWPSKDVPDCPAVLLFNEWLKEIIFELLSPDLGLFVERSLSLGNLQLFGPVTFRVFQPDRSGVKIANDYLHGRDKDELAFECFQHVLTTLTEEHGPAIEQWPYTPSAMSMGELDPFPTRCCGTYWMAVDLGPTIRAADMLVPGQSGLHKSPHFQDQRPLFDEWKLKDMPRVTRTTGREAPAK